MLQVEDKETQLQESSGSRSVAYVVDGEEVPIIDGNDVLLFTLSLLIGRTLFITISNYSLFRLHSFPPMLWLLTQIHQRTERNQEQIQHQKYQNVYESRLIKNKLNSLITIKSLNASCHHRILNRIFVESRCARSLQREGYEVISK